MPLILAGVALDIVAKNGWFIVPDYSITFCVAFGIINAVLRGIGAAATQAMKNRR